MTIRIPITHLRPRKFRFQSIRFTSSSTSGTASKNDGRPLVRYLTKRELVIDHFNYHFKISGNESTGTPNFSKTPSPSNVETIGNTPRITITTVNQGRPRIDLTTGGGGGDNSGLRMRSVRVDQTPARPAGALTGLNIPSIKGLTLPVFEGPSNPIHLNEFLKKYPPSTTTHQSIAGSWVFVKRNNTNPGYPLSKPDNFACAEKAKAVIDDTITRLQSYETDGVTTRGYLLEKVFKSAAGELRDLAVKHNYTCGAWFIPVSTQRVDKVFTELSRSIIAGELSRTFAHAVKATVMNVPRVPPEMHLVNVIVPDAWDKEANRKVLDVLLNFYGLAPSGCKPELFVQIGYGNFHKSKGDSCTFTPQDFFNRHEINQARFAVTKERSFSRGKILGNRLGMGLIDKVNPTGEKANTHETAN
ncbi:hypothetical protein TWF970_001447 [Orbilia oligospora]|uniref:Uncharacterized protein n=1 Tax=Orbilia oligospora TaxID=2813651 RepID=A0A7C8VSE1_ORBOL|nr:hypothetical protein TWF970_001447 [Orbilia oligospora]